MSEYSKDKLYPKNMPAVYTRLWNDVGQKE